jgi:hypothetical protein
MLSSFNAPRAATIASVGLLLAAASTGAIAFFLSGVLEVRAEAPVEIAVHQQHAKSDRLPVFVKGTACSSLGWPHYEQTCQFDMRRAAGEARTVRVIVLR